MAIVHILRGMLEQIVHVDDAMLVSMVLEINV